MASVNKVVLVGNVGKEPEIRSDQKGRKIAHFSLATSEAWRDKMTGEKKEKTEWHKVVVFTDNLVQLVEKYIHKGHKLYIEGSLQTRKWIDKSGIERYITEVVLQLHSTIVMLSGRGDGMHESQYNKEGEMQVPEFVDTDKDVVKHDDIDDEIPF